jgi:excisionase family DNA binding protein
LKTYDIVEAAAFLKVDRSTALDLVGSGEHPGAKIGRAWVFLEDELVDYLRAKTREQTRERRQQREVDRQLSAASAREGSAPPPLRAWRREGRSLPPLPELRG